MSLTIKIKKNIHANEEKKVAFSLKDPIKEHRTDLSGEVSEALRAPPHSPVYFLSIVAISILVAEAFVMILLSQIHPHLLLVTVLIDSTLLILLLSPVLYLFLF